MTNNNSELVNSFLECMQNAVKIDNPQEYFNNDFSITTNELMSGQIYRRVSYNENEGVIFEQVNIQDIINIAHDIFSNRGMTNKQYDLAVNILEKECALKNIKVY